MKPHAIFALLLSIAFPLPSFAQTHVIARIGTAPLTEPISSTAQLQSDVVRERVLFESAGLQLGISPAEYARFAQRIASRQVTYVEIPRHLDAMSWSSAGHAHVVRDVVIPAKTMGWEVDLQEHGQTIALFVPARCGNLSILRKPLPAIARQPLRHPIKTEAAVNRPPAPPATATAPPAVGMPATPPPTPSPVQSVASSTPEHHARWWPLLLIPIVAAFVGASGGASPAHLLPPPGGGVPPPAGCATPAPASR